MVNGSQFILKSQQKFIKCETIIQYEHWNNNLLTGQMVSLRHTPPRANVHWQIQYAPILLFGHPSTSFLAVSLRSHGITESGRQVPISPLTRRHSDTNSPPRLWFSEYMYISCSAPQPSQRLQKYCAVVDILSFFSYSQHYKDQYIIPRTRHPKRNLAQTSTQFCLTLKSFQSRNQLAKRKIRFAPSRLRQYLYWHLYPNFLRKLQRIASGIPALFRLSTSPNSRKPQRKRHLQLSFSANRQARLGLHFPADIILDPF